MTQTKRRKKRRKLKKGVKNFLKLVLVIIIGFFVYSKFKENNPIPRVLSISGPDKIYLAYTQVVKPNIVIETSNGMDAPVKYSSSNKDIVTVDMNGYISGTNIGEANIEINGNGISKKIEVIVTDLIVSPDINQEKQELVCGRYSEEEEQMLEDILDTKINEAGKNTRAGVVAAARFLTLEFPYKINYFYENGRLQGTDNERNYIDGEGRYYHKGLYLSESKFSLLEPNASTASPKTWGCDLYSYSTESYSRNGLNCSGFISWAMLNGGYDVGDIGAGITEQYDFTDMGEKVPIDLDLLNSNRIKVGDLIGRNGHIAIIIGIEKDKIYVAESYIPNLKLRTFTKQELVDSEDFNYIMLMDSVYINDGNLTNMW